LVLLSYQLINIYKNKMNSSSNVISKIDENYGKKRLPYILLLFLGLFFWVASISTFYSLYQQLSFQDWSVDISNKSFVLLCLYIVLNFIAGYGFLFCRRWILSVFLLNTIVMGIVYFFFYLSQGVLLQSALTAGSISLLVSGIAFLFKKYLIISKGSIFVLVGYIVLLLVTMYMTYFF
jgi:hypothetical protein